jgi:hypothetical protein
LCRVLRPGCPGGAAAASKHLLPPAFSAFRRITRPVISRLHYTMWKSLALREKHIPFHYIIQHLRGMNKTRELVLPDLFPLTFYLILFTLCTFRLLHLSPIAPIAYFTYPLLQLWPIAPIARGTSEYRPEALLSTVRVVLLILGKFVGEFA